MNNETKNNIKNGIYQHYKGNKYEVIGVAKNSETFENFVVYRALYDNKISKLWVRPLKMFTETIENDGKEIERFKYISEK